MNDLVRDAIVALKVFAVLVIVLVVYYVIGLLLAISHCLHDIPRQIVLKQEAARIATEREHAIDQVSYSIRKLSDDRVLARKLHLRNGSHRLIQPNVYNLSVDLCENIMTGDLSEFRKTFQDFEESITVSFHGPLAPKYKTAIDLLDMSLVAAGSTYRVDHEEVEIDGQSVHMIEIRSAYECSIRIYLDGVTEDPFLTDNEGFYWVKDVPEEVFKKIGEEIVTEITVARSLR